MRLGLDGAGGTGASDGGSPSTGGSGGEAPVDPCATALFCETFDDYAGVTDIVDDQEFGPWHASLNANGAQMNLDSAHTVSRYLDLHDATAEPQPLAARSSQPLPASSYR